MPKLNVNATTFVPGQSQHHEQQLAETSVNDDGSSHRTPARRKADGHGRHQRHQRHQRQQQRNKGKKQQNGRRKTKPQNQGTKASPHDQDANARQRNGRHNGRRNNSHSKSHQPRQHNHRKRNAASKQMQEDYRLATRLATQEHEASMEQFPALAVARPVVQRNDYANMVKRTATKAERKEDAFHQLQKQLGLTALTAAKPQQQPPAVADSNPPPPVEIKLRKKIPMNKLRDRFWESLRRFEFRKDLHHSVQKHYHAPIVFDVPKEQKEKTASIPVIREPLPAIPKPQPDAIGMADAIQLNDVAMLAKSLKQHDPAFEDIVDAMFLTARLGHADCLAYIVPHLERSSRRSATTFAIRNDDGANLFHVCCHVDDNVAGKVELLKYLIVTILRERAAKTQQQLLYKILSQTNADGSTALHLACASGYVELPQVFLKHCPQALLDKLLQIPDAQQQTPLLAAISANATDTALAMILWRGNHPRNHKYTSGRSQTTANRTCPLSWAAKVGNVEMVELLLEFRDGQCYDLTSALCSSCHNHDMQSNLVALLIHAGANAFDADTNPVLAAIQARVPIDVLRTILKCGKQRLQWIQSTRRKDPVLQKQPESFFRSLEQKETKEQNDAMTHALIHSMLDEALFDYAIVLYRHDAQLYSVQHLKQCMESKRIVEWKSPPQQPQTRPATPPRKTAANAPTIRLIANDGMVFDDIETTMLIQASEKFAALIRFSQDTTQRLDIASHHLRWMLQYMQHGMLDATADLLELIWIGEEYLYLELIQHCAVQLASNPIELPLECWTTAQEVSQRIATADASLMMLRRAALRTILEEFGKVVQSESFLGNLEENGGETAQRMLLQMCLEELMTLD